MNGFSVVSIDHVQLAMPAGGEDEARRFYSALLGLPEKPKPEALAGRGGCWFETPGLRIHLGVEADFRAARKAHPGLRVNGLAALRARLEDHSVETRPGEAVEGCERFFANDPFGNRLEFLEGPPA